MPKVHSNDTSLTVPYICWWWILQCLRNPLTHHSVHRLVTITTKSLLYLSALSSYYTVEQVTAQEMEMKRQKAAANQQRRKSGLVQPVNCKFGFLKLNVISLMIFVQTLSEIKCLESISLDNHGRKNVCYSE